jgi:hypothetical protein
MHDQIGRRTGQHGQPLGAQPGGRLEAAVGQQVVLEAAIDRPGMCPATGSMVSFSPRKRSAPRASTRRMCGVSRRSST